MTAALALSLLIENSSENDNLFLALGYTVASAKNNIFECGGFGVRYYFGSRCKPCKYQGITDALRIKTKTGIKYLVAFGTNTKTANNSWHGWHVSGFLFDEIDRACEESITEMQQRITAVENPHIIVTQNPNVPSHPIYKLLEDLEKRHLVNYSHWVLNDNIGLSQAKIDEVKSRYDPSSLYYRRYIMGERVSPDSIIFNIRDYNIISEYNPEDYQFYITVADPGKTVSATTFIMAGYNYKTKSLDILREYSWKNNNRNMVVEKHSDELAKEFIQFTDECQTIMKKKPVVCIIDGFYGDDFFDKAFIYSRQLGKNFNIKVPISSEGKSGKDEDDLRISRTSSLLFQR